VELMDAIIGLQGVRDKFANEDRELGVDAVDMMLEARGTSLPMDQHFILPDDSYPNWWFQPEYECWVRRACRREAKAERAAKHLQVEHPLRMLLRS
jgi:hypothetical protein